MALRPVTFDEKDLKKLFKSNTPLAKFVGHLKRFLRTAVYFLLLFAIFFYLLNLPAFLKRSNYSPQASPPAPAITTPPTVYASEILIPKLGLHAPVIYDASYNELLDRLRSGVVRYEGSANPGEIGNLVILGHSSDYPWSTGGYKTIFALLDKLAAGDEITLPYGTNRYVYKVTQVRVVKANDLSVLSRTPTPILTLITCYPVGTAINRLIVTAELESEPTGAIQETEPYLGKELTTAR